MLAAHGQLAGSRGGVGEVPAGLADFAPLAPDVAQGYVAIDGRVVGLGITAMGLARDCVRRGEP